MLGSAAARQIFQQGQGSCLERSKKMKTFHKIAAGAAMMLGASLATAAPAAAQSFGFSFGGPGYSFGYSSPAYGYYGSPYYGYAYPYAYGSPYYYGRPYYARPYYGRPYAYGYGRSYNGRTYRR